jgi:hypothetical protein
MCQHHWKHVRTKLFFGPSQLLALVSGLIALGDRYPAREWQDGALSNGLPYRRKRRLGPGKQTAGALVLRQGHKGNGMDLIRMRVL